MKQRYALSCLFRASAIAIVAAAPVWAAATQVTGVNVNASGAGIQVLLETNGGDRPQVFTVNRGTDVVADIVNTQLRLPDGQSFRQNNPAPGIASVVVTPLDANSIRVIVSGNGSAPEVQINQAAANGISLTYVSGAGGVATAPDEGRTPAVPPAPPPAIGQANTPPAPPSSPTAQQSDVMVPNPQVSIDGAPAPIVRPNQAPPFLPRAVAPPVGDIAVSNLNTNGTAINLETTEVIPRLVLRDAPVRDVLALLARAAGLNLAYASGQPTDDQQADEGEEELEISLDIENEPVQDVFNYILRLSGLEANRQGNTIFVGTRLPDVARNVVTRTLRLNQLDIVQTLNFLVSQGAERNEVRTTTQTVVTGEGATAQSFTNTTTTVELIAPDTQEEPYEGIAPLPLKGLLVSGDQRTNSITLVGPPDKVELASAYLAQLDVRKRQVAVNVKIIDVNLSNTDDFGTSFSFGINDSFFVNDNGAAAVNFGDFTPANRATVTGGLLVPPVITNPIEGDVQFDRQNLIQVPLTGTRGGALFLRPLPPVSGNPLNPRVAEYEVFEVDPDTGIVTAGEATFSLPTLFQYPRKFLAQLQAQIQSRNAKILTDPTLVVQENQAASVQLTQEVLERVDVTFTDTPSGQRETREPVLRPVGLTLNLEVNKIDDNGFVTLTLNPVVSSPIGQEETGLGGFVTLVQERSLNSGQLRLRDGQTLIVSGIIQDQDRVTVSKVPILGDLPLIGSLFRSTNKANQRAEVIVLLTPQILDDTDRSNFGYSGYVPGRDAQQMLNQAQ